METETDAAFRLRHIGGSEASALVGLSPRNTPWSLYQLKAGNIEPDDFSQLGERQRWGLNLERAILNETATRLAKPIRKWMAAPLSNGFLGGHPDGRDVNGSGKTRAIVETKTTDWLIWKGWGEEPPEHYIIQLQTYMGLAGVDTGYLCILVGGNDLKIYEYEFRPKLFDLLNSRAVEMLERVARKDPPPVNFERDAEAIAEVYRTGGGEPRDMTGHNRFAELCEEYGEASALEKAGEARKKAAAAELKVIADGSDELFGMGYRLKFTNIAAVPDRIITADDIGGTIKGRAGQRKINPPRAIGGK